MRTETGVTIRLDDYQPANFAIPEVHLVFKLLPEATRVIATLHMVPKMPGQPLVLDGDGLALIGVLLNGIDLDRSAYKATPDSLEVYALPDDAFTLTIETEINPAANTALMGLYRTKGVYCTQCEAEGFRRITYFLDRPDVLSIYHVRIEADGQENPLLLSNGNPVRSAMLEGGTHIAEWHDPHPKPSYLFALVAGDLAAHSDQFITASGRHVALNIYVEHGKAHLADYAMDALKRSMKWDEEVFGLEYDLDLFNIVAVSDFNMGAMENKGLNVFNDKYVLADPETATDQDFANIEAIIAHEYFHNWTGNRITCRDWFQLCLKEGLTVFRDHEFSADQRSRPVKRIQEIRTLKSQQFPEDQGPLAHAVRPRSYKEINNFYTATVYEKGSEVVRMLQTMLGDAVFKQSLALYFKRHDGDAATIEEFLACFAEVSGRNLAQFSLWYEQAGTPHLAIEECYDATAKTYQLTITQSSKPTPKQPKKLPMQIPVAFELLSEQGEPLAFARVAGAEIIGNVCLLSDAKHVITFEGVETRPIASLLRGFSAPVTVSRTLSVDDQYILATKETDPVNRWMAIIGVYNQVLIEATQKARQGQPIQVPERLIGMVSALLEDEALDAAFIALCLALPTEGEIAQEIGTNIDPDAIYAARQAIQQMICKALIDALSQRRGQCKVAGVFTADAESAGERALYNRLLEMEAIGRDDALILANGLAKAHNMTDRMARLTALCLYFPGHSATASALAAFRQHYDGNALVLDKWFALVAAIPGEGALQRVRATMQDPAFDLGNPNRMRSLVGSFAGANPTGFHRLDGKAYGFFAETILMLDKRNPQLAARMLTVLRAWASLEPQRKSQLREALSTIAHGKGLSRDLGEIVERMIG